MAHAPLSSRGCVMASFPHPIRSRPNTQEQRAERSGVVLLLVQQLVSPILFPESEFLSEKGKREMSFIRAIVVDPEVQGWFAIKEVEAPQAGPSEALVQVEAISLNRAEGMGAMHAEAGWRPGRNGNQPSGHWNRTKGRGPGAGLGFDTLMRSA